MSADTEALLARLERLAAGKLLPEERAALDSLAAELERVTAAQSGLETALEQSLDREERVKAERDAAALELVRLIPQLDKALSALRAYDNWASSMPDALFNDKDPRWSWWHRRPYDIARAAIAEIEGEA